MRRKLLFTLVALFLAALVALPAAAQESLADAARAAQKNKRPRPANEIVYTNDNIPETGMVSTVGEAPAPAAETGDKAKAGEKAGAKDQAASAEDQKKLEEEWRKKFADARNELALLQREYDIAQKEHQLQAAVFYADAGTRLRNDRQWADQERDFQATMAAKKAKIDAQKQKIDDLTEELRKAGLPSSWAQ